jgi:hypothetical protein
MASHHCSKWINRNERRDAPIPWKGNCACDHNSCAYEAKYESEFESFEETRKFFKERGIFNLLRSSSPGHIDFKEVAEEGLRDMEGYSAEEDAHEEKPFEVFEYWAQCQLLIVFGDERVTYCFQEDFFPTACSGG